MNLNEKWEPNLVLNYIEGDTSYHEDLNVIWLYFSFYDCHYCLGVSKKDCEKDLENDFLSFSLDGQSKLFSAFEDLMEDKYAKKIQEQFIRYKKYLIEEEEELNKPIPELDLTKFKRVYWLEYFKDEDKPTEKIEIEISRIENIEYKLSKDEYLEPKHQ